MSGRWYDVVARRSLPTQLRADPERLGPPLEFDAVVFRTGPNRNHVRFRAADLPSFAASFAGLPFLRNHAVEDVGARDGTVIASALVGNGFHQRIRLTTVRGVQDFQAGILDRFSIGWFYAGVECSICGRDWFGCGHWPGRRYAGPGERGEGGVAGEVCELLFIEPTGKETSAVNAPAVPGTHVVEELCTLKETQMSHSIYLPNGAIHPVMAAPQPVHAEAAAPDALATELATQVRELQAALADQQCEALLAAGGLSAAGQEMVRLALAHVSSGRDATYVAQLIEQQRRVEATARQGGGVPSRSVKGIRPIGAGEMQTPEDRVQAALDWLLGARAEPLPPPSLRSIREVYQAITGDHNWYGVFNPEWSQLAAASTTTLAGMVVNALNKVVRQHYDNLVTYRWYEPLVDVVPHDGSTHAVQLIMVDGLSNLPSVGEGAAYTEAVVGDSKESFAFIKRGHYVGITLETIRRGNLQRLQAIPRELVKAAVRARSAAIAALFTANAGAGPTLADDSTALFHANHGNLDTTAFSSAAWGAARQRIWNQTVPGTGSPLGLWPTFCLLPIELYDSALESFGYGSGDVGKPNSGGTAQTPNPYGASRPGDPRPIPVAVPDWTDGTDWAYLVDPRLHPVIHMAYANAPQGGDHPLPEIFEATGESTGLMFTNDTLPVKIRDWWGYGVSSYVGVGKNNVAGG
jgi:hypothetical protein